ncbi:MAG TPA: hypothetical protein VKA15_24690, partial [Isosphaeraceae bacterium]|nr:hypothetical protein [Isosphaeraceae bacterium]
MARSIALVSALASGAIGAFSQTARADYYAFANSQDLGYATLSLTVGNTTVNISTGGFQGWISN